MEEKLMIPCGGIELEAVLRPGDPARAGVVCHPHTLYGGNMHNNVVEAAVEALALAGWTALRFNFRGAGRSGGRFEDGRGEKEDLAAALSFLIDRGAVRPLVVGYSFGAWVAAMAWPVLQNLAARPLVLIAPPAAFMSFDGMPRDAEIGLMICGEHDDVGPPHLAEELGSQMSHPVKPEVIRGADHFFGGRETALTERIGEYLAGL